MNILPVYFLFKKAFRILSFKIKSLLPVTDESKNKYKIAICLNIVSLFLIFSQAPNRLSSLISPIGKLEPLTEAKSKHEVFGFAPYWTFDQLSNVDFNILTTFAYFDIEVLGSGNLVKEGPGYETFISNQATTMFRKAHQYGTRVVVTFTQMDNDQILSLMDNTAAWPETIRESVDLVKQRGIDGINIDFEYMGNPGQGYRNKFTAFVAALTKKMHEEIPSSQVTVSVYASAIKDPKIYDIKELANVSDGIFMMAYDFAVKSSDNAIPTAPLYGYKSGKYWYDISTAVSDFLSVMPADKLILGVPYYGYNWAVYEPKVKAETRPTWSWRGKPATQTYSLAKENITTKMEGISHFSTGWDSDGQVGYQTYYVESTDTWRMLFLDDVDSLSKKYDFAKEKNLLGVGMWALGFDDGRSELWSLLREKFGTKLVDISVARKEIRSML